MATHENTTNTKTEPECDKKSLSNDNLDKKNLGDDGELQAVTTITAGQSYEYTDAQYKKLTRKIDRYLMPILFFMYGIQQTDKTCISIQALFNMQDDLGLHGQQYQWLTTIFYLSYLIGEFPSTWLLQRFDIGKVLTIYMMGWSICLICTSATQNWAQIMALRALQGFFECNITPGFLIITGSFWRTKEHASRSLLWQVSQGFFSIICNLMLYGIARYVARVGGISPWRVVPIFLGGLTLVGSLFSWYLLGAPTKVRWLTEEEKKMAVARVAENQISEESSHRDWNWDQFWECFRDPQVYFGFANSFLACVPNGGITTFSSLLFETFGFTSWETMLYQLPRSAMYIVVFIVVAFYLERFQNQRMYVMIISCILSCVGMLVMSLLPNTAQYKWVKWGMFDMTTVFSFAIFLGWSLITSNVAGTTKRTVVSSLTLIAYCVGNMIGAQAFKTSQAPRYIEGTVACTVCFGLEVIVIILWKIWYMYENRRRDRLAAETGISKEEQEKLGEELGEQDVTDFKNPHFRYTM